MRISFVFLLLWLHYFSYAQDNLLELSYEALDSLTMLQYQKGNYKGALHYTKICIEKSKKALGVSSPEYVSYVEQLGSLYDRSHQYDKAIPTLKEALDLTAQVGGEKTLDYARISNVLGRTYMNLGKLDEAELLQLKAKKIIENIKQKKTLEYGDILNDLAVLYVRQERYKEAIYLYSESSDIRKELVGEKHPLYAQSLNNLAVAYKKNKAYPKAEKLYLQTIVLRKEIFGTNHPYYTRSLSNLAALYITTKAYEKAESLLKEALAIEEKNFGKQTLNYSGTLHNLGAVYVRSKNFEKALETGQEALAIRANLLGVNHPKYLLTLDGLIGIQIDLGALSKAWDLAGQSLRINSQKEMTLNITRAWADSLLQCDFIALDQALNLLKKIDRLLVYEQKEHYQAQQLIIIDVAIKLLKRKRNAFASSRDKLRILSVASDWTLKGLNILTTKKDIDKALEFAELGKSVLLMDALKAESARSFGDLPDSLVLKERQLQKKLSKLEGLSFERLSAEKRTALNVELNKLYTEQNAFKKQIEQNYPKYTELKYEPKEIDITQIQQLLDTESALIEYVVGEEEIYIFYIDHKNSKLLSQSITLDSLKKAIQSMHHLLNDYSDLAEHLDENFTQFIQQSNWFYKLLLEPVLEGQQIKKLTIITDGELGHLPFEAFIRKLPEAEDVYSNLHYLIRDYEVSYAYSAMLWREQQHRARSKNNGQILAMSAEYSLQTDLPDFRLPIYKTLRKRLGPLPEAKREVENLEKTFQGFFAYDQDATETEFKKQASDYAILHLAMHGLLSKKQPLLSSLVFSEDGDSLENNFLQAYEISKMDIHADLVVLSACETGFGKFEKGNGIASLARSFMYAGAGSLLVTLWQVNDYATAEIMKLFYENLSVGLSKSEALRQAKLSFIEQRNDLAAYPAFWSAFILIGNTDPIELNQPQSLNFWWIGGGLFLCLGFVGWFVRRKKKLA